MGAFTHTDQKCVDVAYLRDPAMAEHCGLRNAAGWYSDALDGAAAPSEAWAAREGACAEPEGAWDTLGTCGYADRLGELLDGTKCVTATARWSGPYSRSLMASARSSMSRFFALSPSAPYLRPRRFSGFPMMFR